MAGQTAAKFLAASQIESNLQEVVGKLDMDMVDLSLNSDDTFAGQFATTRRNAKIQQEQLDKLLAQQRLDQAKSFAVRQQQVGSPGNIKAPARIRNRV